MSLESQYPLLFFIHIFLTFPTITFQEHLVVGTSSPEYLVGTSLLCPKTVSWNNWSLSWLLWQEYQVGTSLSTLNSHSPYHFVTTEQSRLVLLCRDWTVKVGTVLSGLNGQSWNYFVKTELFKLSLLCQDWTVKAGTVLSGLNRQSWNYFVKTEQSKLALFCWD